MSYIRSLIGEKEDFERFVSDRIKEWEHVKDKQPEREDEYNNVIWGAHRILDLLDVNITEDNDVI